MENQIYVIVFTEYGSNGYMENVYVGEKYFANKDKAIIYLLERDYKHICDDEYELAWYLHAEIFLLEMEEDKL